MNGLMTDFNGFCLKQVALNKIIEVQSEQRATLMQKFLEAIFGVAQPPDEPPGPCYSI